ncbi:MBL fold metallo-hydrolase [Mesorhizobium sp. M0601]|uniref:MBL fold metallo-hydrolase n=1 Tax=Mesorhizobium sp. M0601 TaxID=2956969 RepID=UPI003339C23C
MIVTSQTNNVLGSTSGRWRVWSLSDGYIEMPADLLRDPQDNPVPQAALAGALRLSVNCFALAGPGVDGVLIDSGGGGWAPTVGRLEQAMAEAKIDPASITVLALTHAHQDHVHGLLTPDGRVLFPNLKAIVIPEAAVQSFFAYAHLAQFRPLLKAVQNGDHVGERLRAVALPGHAAGHTGYTFDTDEDRFLFFGDIVHVPALQFGTPAFSWGYDDDQLTARATRLKVFSDAAEGGRGSPAGTLAGRASVAWCVRAKHTAMSRQEDE